MLIHATHRARSRQRQAGYHVRHSQPAQLRPGTSPGNDHGNRPLSPESKFGRSRKQVRYGDPALSMRSSAAVEANLPGAVDLFGELRAICQAICHQSASIAGSTLSSACRQTRPCGCRTRRTAVGYGANWRTTACGKSETVVGKEFERKAQAATLAALSTFGATTPSVRRSGSLWCWCLYK